MALGGAMQLRVSKGKLVHLALVVTWLSILQLTAPAALATGWEQLPEWNSGDVPERGDPWAVTIYGGLVSTERLSTILLEPWNASVETDTPWLGGSISKRIGALGKGLTFELEGGAGYRFSNEDAGEVWGGLFARWDRFPWQDKVYTTIAVSTGLNYATRVSEIEWSENNSKLLHYLGPEITIADPDNKNLEGVLRLHHRSGVYGTFNGVRGGSNIVTIGARKRF
jgi:hypothetical protein